MSRENLLVAVIIVSILNGIFSPWVWLAVGMAPAWMPGFVGYTTETLFYGGSLLISTMTLLVSGVPAALSERFLRDDLSPTGVMWLWLSCALLLSLPAVEGLVAQL